MALSQGQPVIPPSVIFVTSAVSLLVEQRVESLVISGNSRAKILIAEWRPDHYVFMVGTAQSRAPLIALGFDIIEEHLLFDEVDLTVSAVVHLPQVESTDPVATYNLPREALLRLTFDSAISFLLFRHYICLRTLPICPTLKGDETEAIVKFFGSINCSEFPPRPRSFTTKPSLPLLLPLPILGAAFVVGAAVALIYTFSVNF
ncbi:hypothetical protein AB1N83_010707 [Pleurotus pulmonarius]|nr:hypothetical protein EYR36_010669 [Pleurotus pulmonarius]KAF4590574.1 hypothetical protein EYR38_009876 [Pleurotus pulmonarius]